MPRPTVGSRFDSDRISLSRIQIWCCDVYCRRGRFDQQYEVGLPDKEAREKIFKGRLQRSQSILISRILRPMMSLRMLNLPNRSSVSRSFISSILAPSAIQQLWLPHEMHSHQHSSSMGARFTTMIRPTRWQVSQTRSSSAMCSMKPASRRSKQPFAEQGMRSTTHNPVPSNRSGDCVNRECVPTGNRLQVSIIY